MLDLRVVGQQAQHGLLAVDGWDDGDAHVDVFARHHGAEVPVLRQIAFGDVHVAHDLHACEQRRVHGAADGEVVVDDAVDADADVREVLERLDVDVGGTGAVRALNQAVEQVDDGGVARVGRHVDLREVGKRVEVEACVLCLHEGVDLGVVVLLGAHDGRVLCELDLDGAPGQLADLLDSVEVERVVGHDGDGGVRRGNGQRARLLRDVFRHEAYRVDVHVHGADVDQRHVEALRERVEHLVFGDVAQVDERLTQAHAAVLALVGESLLELVVVDVVELLQDIADADLSIVLNVCHRASFPCTSRRPGLPSCAKRHRPVRSCLPVPI